MTRGSSGGTTKDPRTRVKVGDVPTLRSLLDRLRALPAARADALVAAVLLAEGALRDRSPLRRWTGAKLALVAGVLTAQAAALAVRRRWPVVPLLVVYGLEPLLQRSATTSPTTWPGPFFWMLLAGYTWGMHTEGVRLWAGAVFAVGDARARRRGSTPTRTASPPT